MRENKQTKMRNKQTKKHMESSFVLIFANERRHYTGRITLRSFYHLRLKLRVIETTKVS